MYDGNIGEESDGPVGFSRKEAGVCIVIRKIGNWKVYQALAHEKRYTMVSLS